MPPGTRSIVRLIGTCIAMSSPARFEQILLIVRSQSAFLFPISRKLRISSTTLRTLRKCGR